MFFSRTSSSTDKSTGAQAEAYALAFLEGQGLVKLTQNYRCKLGEIDLIMQDKDQLVFVEVRLRTHRAFANAAESVTIRKQQKIIKTALYYLQQHRLTESAHCRFDVIAFSDTGAPDWIKDAFSAG